MNLFYRETSPPVELQNLVLSFWEFTVREGEFAPLEHEIFPDGCVSLFYHRNEKSKFSRLILSGLLPVAITVPVFPGDVYWGMRISPAACDAVLRSDPGEFRNKRMAEAKEFPHLTADLLEQLDDCRSFDEAREIYQKCLQALNLGFADADEKVLRAMQIIEENNSEIKISQLAAAVNLSARQLERRFKKCSGLSPKQYARARRIRATAIDWLENQSSNWANRAAEMGFTDQSHLTREFVSVTRRSPNSFAAKVKEIKHGNLVK